MVSDHDPSDNGIFPSDLTAVNNTLYFAGIDPNEGMQVFESNGTAAGTADGRRDRQGNPGCYPTDLTGSGQLAVLPGHRRAHGTQLWIDQPDKDPRDDGTDLRERDGRRGSEP